MAQNIALTPAQTESVAKATELIGYGQPAIIAEGYGKSVRLTYIDPTETLRLTIEEDGSFARLDLWETEGETPLDGSYDDDWMEVNEGEFGLELKALING